MALINRQIFKGSMPKDLQCVTEWLQRPDGTKLRVRVYNARVQFRRPALVRIHLPGCAGRLLRGAGLEITYVVNQEGDDLVVNDELRYREYYM